MSDIGVKQKCHVPPTLFGLYIDELETYLHEIEEGCPCLFNTVVAILLYAKNVYSRIWPSL